MFIHPEIAKPVMPQQIKKLAVPCKFFPYCSNPACPFVHPVTAQPYYMQPKPSFTATGQRLQIPCKNADSCTRPDCHFLHPKDPNPQTEIIVTIFYLFISLRFFFKKKKTCIFLV